MVKCPLSGSHTLETYRKEGMITMKAKRKLLKMFVLTLALAMVFSVTAFAGSVSWTTDGGASAYGSCGMYSATTSVSSPMYVYARVTMGYINNLNYYHEVQSESSNAGTSITASVSRPSDFAVHNNTRGYHTAGSTSRSTNY